MKRSTCWVSLSGSPQLVTTKHLFLLPKFELKLLFVLLNCICEETEHSWVSIFFYVPSSEQSKFVAALSCYSCRQNDGEIIVWDVDQINIGNDYDTVTGLYTAPSLGYYRYSWPQVDLSVFSHPVFPREAEHFFENLVSKRWRMCTLALCKQNQRPYFFQQRK